MSDINKPTTDIVKDWNTIKDKNLLSIYESFNLHITKTNTSCFMHMFAPVTLSLILAYLIADILNWLQLLILSYILGTTLGLTIRKYRRRRLKRIDIKKLILYYRDGIISNCKMMGSNIIADIQIDADNFKNISISAFGNEELNIGDRVYVITNAQCNSIIALSEKLFKVSVGREAENENIKR